MPRRAPTPELRAELEHALAEHFGDARRIVKLKRRLSPYRGSYAIEELDVALDGGATLKLVFKDFSEGALLRDARRVRPPFLYDPLREVEVYRDLLAPVELGTAVYYGAAADAELGRYWLFLENVEGMPLWQVGELAIWERVARWLGTMHGTFSDDLRWQQSAHHLLHYDAGLYRRWMRRAQAFSRKGEAASSASRESVEWLAARYDNLIERLVSLPSTFIHGELYAKNVLVQGPDAERVCPLDWERAAIGPGLFDLAALAAGEWTNEDRRALALAYRSALPSVPAPIAAEDSFLAALDCCRLHLAVEWLGFARVWAPPAPDSEPWLAEALRLAEELRL